MIGLSCRRQVRRAQIRRGRHGFEQSSVVGEDRLFDVAQCRTGLDPQLGGQLHTGTAIGGQGVRWSTGLVEGDHQLTPGSLAVRVGLHERFEVTDALLPAATG